MIKKNWVHLVYHFEYMEKNKSTTRVCLEMLQEGPNCYRMVEKKIQEADLIVKMGQKVMYSLGKVKIGPPTPLSSLIHSF